MIFVRHPARSWQARKFRADIQPCFRRNNSGQIGTEKILSKVPTEMDRLNVPMKPDVPYFVETKNGSDRCVRLQDGRFHLFWPGPLTNLFYGTDHILVSEAFADVLRDVCVHCLDLRCTELVKAVTGERFGYYYEVLPYDEITPADINSVRASGCHAWHFCRRHLFVSPTVIEYIRQRGIGELSYSLGFSRFAGAA